MIFTISRHAIFVFSPQEVLLFVNSFGRRLNQDTSTCDGCNTIMIRNIGCRYYCMECECMKLCDICFKSTFDIRLGVRITKQNGDLTWEKPWVNTIHYNAFCHVISKIYTKLITLRSCFMCICHNQMKQNQ